MQISTVLKSARDGSLGIVLGSTLVLTAALAAEHGMLDTDGDGLVSFDEVVAVFPDITEDVFATLDVDGNGGLDEAELAAAQEAGLMMSEG